MAKFGRLKKLDIAGRTIEFVLEEAHVPAFNEEPPVLHLAHMGRANRDYFNARMTISAKGMARAVKGKSTKSSLNKAAVDYATQEASNIERDRELMPLYVVKGWDRMYSDDGTLVPFTTEDCIDLFGQLPDDVIERMKGEAGDITEFRDVVGPTAEEAEAALGNSDSD